MDFVIDSLEEDRVNNAQENSFQLSTTPEVGMSFDFVEEYDSDSVTEKESDSNDESDANYKKKSIGPIEQESNLHPLAHLFDEAELTKLRPNSEEASIRLTSDIKKYGKTENEKNSEKTLFSKLHDGLSKKTKRRILPLLDSSRKKEIDELLAKSEILNTNIEDQTFCIDPPLSKRKLKKLKKQEKEKTKGDKWFNLPATELTEEVKRDLELMQMRSVLDPKHFYKKNHMKVLPKYFQVGKVVDSPIDFYNNRLTKKERKRTLVDELMADAEFNKYNKSKYAEILKEKQKTHYKAWRQAKRLKSKKQ